MPEETTKVRGSRAPTARGERVTVGPGESAVGKRRHLARGAGKWHAVCVNGSAPS